MRHLCMTAAFAGAIVLAGWLYPPAIALAGDVVKQAQPEKRADCELILEGRGIEKLVLSDKQGKVISLVRPGACVLLPAGEYQIEEIGVEGGWSSGWSIEPRSSAPPLHWPPPPDRLLALSPGKPCQPDIGMPLKSEISAKRVGGLIKVSYRPWLRDGGGRPYMTLNSTPPPPQFAIYQGERDITASGAGSLEYG
jgi:hypothetical protein